MTDSQKKIVYLDMDGVACNFVKAALQASGHDYESSLKHWPTGVYSVATVAGRTEEQLWSVLDALGKHFWIELDEYPHFEAMHRMLTELYDVHFLSTPAWSPDSVEGKLAWLQARYGKDFRNYVFTSNKYLCAGPGRVLVDDSPHHCREFLKQGGGAVLIEQPWNRHERDGLRTVGLDESMIVAQVAIEMRRVT